MNTFIFIDGSYFCFYRYHSLITWWKNAFPEQLDVLENPFQNEIFLEKYKKTFIDSMKKIKKNLNLSNPTIIVGKDCKRDQIWRNNLFPNYKSNRNNEGFMGGPFFKMTYEQDLFIKGGASAILNHPHLEADDCIAITVKHLLEKDPDCQIYIITSDKDYLQIAQERVHLFNLAFKDLTEQKSSTKNSKCDLFCKIICGDPSDNIPSVFPKCGPKTALKYFNNPHLLEQKLSESTTYRDVYELNKTLVDFNNIPEQLVNEFLTVLPTFI
jgi:5'-3' exonuclease